MDLNRNWLSYSENPNHPSPRKKSLILQPGDEFEETACNPGFEIVKFYLEAGRGVTALHLSVHIDIYHQGLPDINCIQISASFQSFVPGLTSFSLLESKSGFGIVNNLLTPHNDQLHYGSFEKILWFLWNILWFLEKINGSLQNEKKKASVYRLFTTRKNWNARVLTAQGRNRGSYKNWNLFRNTIPSIRDSFTTPPAQPASNCRTFIEVRPACTSTKYFIL